MFFVIEFFLTNAFYQFFRNYWIFINHGLFFGKNIFYNATASNFERNVFSGGNH